MGDKKLTIAHRANVTLHGPHAILTMELMELLHEFGHTSSLFITSSISRTLLALPAPVALHALRFAITVRDAERGGGTREEGVEERVLEIRRLREGSVWC